LKHVKEMAGFTHIKKMYACIAH